MRVLLIPTLALTTACGASALQPETPLDHSPRDPCYERAEAEAQERVDRECPGAFASCPARADIMEELRLAHEACP